MRILPRSYFSHNCTRNRDAAALDAITLSAPSLACSSALWLDDRADGRGSHRARAIAVNQYGGS
jgi:hypothetical protein